MTAPRVELIDVHAHFLTDAYVAAATAAGHAHPDGLAYWPTWSPEDHLKLMDEGSIATSVLSMSSPGTHFGDDTAARALTRQVNEYGASLVHDHPGRFGLFASLPLPDIEGSLTEIAYAFDELRCDGVALMTNVHGRYLGDAAFAPVWADLERRGAAVFVHPTSPPNPDPVSLGKPRAMLEFLFDSARTAADLSFAGVLTRYPGIRWVFTHGGGPAPPPRGRSATRRTRSSVGRSPGRPAATPSPMPSPA
ncbi:amidohydrolase family protein [Streptomyces fractus]|uniref:amidohydrolase family protein n=1 Tax=Streptomyces fractus TaxID=641806 RepID=UPI003CFA68AB